MNEKDKAFYKELLKKIEEMRDKMTTEELSKYVESEIFSDPDKAMKRLLLEHELCRLKIEKIKKAYEDVRKEYSKYKEKVSFKENE